MISIRGATTVAKDDSDELLQCTKILLESIINSNSLDVQDITAIFFTCTKDLTSAYPAKAARELGITQAALMCMQEMHVEGSLSKCIRVCIFCDAAIARSTVKHIYLNNAVILRPDLINE